MPSISLRYQLQPNYCLSSPLDTASSLLAHLVYSSSSNNSWTIPRPTNPCSWHFFIVPHPSPPAFLAHLRLRGPPLLHYSMYTFNCLGPHGPLLYSASKTLILVQTKPPLAPGLHLAAKHDQRKLPRSLVCLHHHRKPQMGPQHCLAVPVVPSPTHSPTE